MSNIYLSIIMYMCIIIIRTLQMGKLRFGEID